MATTTNFGWTTPNDTDLVKDGAAAIRTLGQSIDTSFVDLKGGTTGQVLAKASNTDLDYSWVTDATGIPATIFDAKGDIIAATAADTASRLAVGANDTVLTADSTTATGLKWAAPGGAGANWSLLNSGGTSLSGASTITVSGISGKDKIMILIVGASSTNQAATISLRLNTDTASNYYSTIIDYSWNSSYAASNYNSSGNFSDRIFLGKVSDDSNAGVAGNMLITGCNSSGVKVYQGFGSGRPRTGTGHQSYFSGGYYNSSSAISSVSVVTDTGTFDDSDGKIFVYTSA